MPKIISMSEPKRKKPVIRRRYIAAAVVLIGLLVVSGAIWWNYRQEIARQQETAKIRAAKIDKLNDDAVRIGAPGADKQMIISAYDIALKDESDNSFRVKLLIGKAVAYMNSGDIDNALKTALEAEKIHSTTSGTSLIASIYEQKGDKAKAIEYYKKYVLLAKKDTSRLVDTSYFDSRIKTLGEQL